MAQTLPRYQVKAGRFNYDPDTKRVKVGKEKGLLAFFTVKIDQLRIVKPKIM